ncbi:MAG TPA: GTPase [Acidimicrobiia bacterium]|nr:GTPase [Acidimicrobiia bacterium]
MSELISVIDGLDLVVALADGQVQPEDLARARAEADLARDRRGHPGGTLVLALLGGTGSGKSSLLNALAGERVAEVSALRPHTTRPLAWVPQGAEPALGQLLDRLGVGERVVHERFPGIALLDLTDVDSIDRSHRTAVETLLPDIDGVVWVLDPVKYNDPVLHEEFIAPLADSADQFVFVLNQIDRLGEDEPAAVLDDLVATLERDGVRCPAVFAVAADPPGGAPIGVDALAAHLHDRLDAKRLQLGKVLADARRTIRTLADAAGLRRGGTLHFEERWAEAVDGISTDLALGGPTPVIVEQALCTLEDLVGRLAAEAGGPFAARLRRAFPPAVVEEAVRTAAARMEAEVPRTTGRRVVDPEQRARAAEVAADQLQHRLGGPLRRVVWDRAALAASLTGVTVDALRAEAALQREDPAAAAEAGRP